MIKMIDALKDPLEDIIKRINRTALTTFAELYADVTVSTGESARSSNRAFARIKEYLTPQGELTEEGVTYVTNEIKGNRILRENYQRFLRGVIEALNK